ncbi:MAG: hypothetical protein HUJ65_03005 [Oscillospiraceae bacterium]|nr:hypothetical protein [Oscillospiraceae bacterium]
MKIAILLEEQNFRSYSSHESLPDDFELLFFGNESPDEDAIAASGAEMLVADPMVRVTASLIKRMPNLKLIQSQGVGYNFFDIAAARERGVDVANCAGANAGAVAEHAVFLMLSVLKNAKEFDRMVFEGRQIEAKNRSFAGGITELGDCHVGIIGFGDIGRRTAELVRAFGSRVSFYNRTPKNDSGFEMLPLDRLLAECDIVSVHLAVTPETIGFIGDRELELMKPGSIIINTARGEIIDRDALCRALVSGKLAGAGLDVLSPEPVTSDHPVLNLPAEIRDRVIISPHIAGLTEGCFRRYFGITWDNARRILRGERPINIVN